MVPDHEFDLGAALRQMNGISQIVLVGEGAYRLHQLGRRCFGQRRGRKDADAAIILAVPGREQIADPLHAFVTPRRREFGRLAFGQALDRHRARDILAVGDGFREDAAQAGLRQGAGIGADATGEFHDRRGAGLDRFQRADRDHQGSLIDRKQAFGPDGDMRGIGKAEILVETAAHGLPQMGMTVDQARQNGLSAPVINFGVGIFPHSRIGGTDCGDLAVHHRQCHIILYRIGIGDSNMREDDRPYPLRLDTALLQQNRRRTDAGAGAGKKLAPVDIGRLGGWAIQDRLRHGGSPVVREMTADDAAMGA